MADFQKAMPFVYENEKGYVDDPIDPGGATNHGISLRLLKSLNLDIDGDGDVDADDIKNLTKDEAFKLYKQVFWDKYSYEKINDHMVATKVFDFTVNMGPSRSHKIAQLSVNLRSHEKIKEDGIMGPKTIEAINKGDPHLFIPTLIMNAILFYETIVKNRPSSMKYLKGWINRAKKL